jgi:Skp family chaperone for outer membrane proteins
MKGSTFILLVIAASAIASIDHIDTEHEAVLLEITEMKKKGATELDCKELAKTSCTEVEKERTYDQKVINGLKTGRECDNLGQDGVRKATLHFKRTKKTHQAWKIKVNEALNYKVGFSARPFSSLKPGRCGFIFTTRSYLSAKAKVSHAVRVEISWRARVSEAWKMVIRMKTIAKKMVHRCRCATKTTFKKVWRTVTRTERLAGQNKAHAKCRMMQCILNNTPLNSSSCKASLKKLVKKKLTSATERVSCSGYDQRVRKERAAKGTELVNKRREANKKEQKRKKEVSNKAKDREAKLEKSNKARERRVKHSERTTKAAEKRAKAHHREKSSKALEQRNKAIERKNKASQLAKERRGKMVLKSNTNYRWRPAHNNHEAVQYPGGFKKISGTGWQMWQIRKGIAGRNPLHGWGSWHKGAQVLRSGDVVSLWNPTGSRVYDCAWGKCTHQPFPPPRGHWGTPYRIYKKGGGRGQVIYQNDSVFFDRMWHFRFVTNRSLRCYHRYCAGVMSNQKMHFKFTKFHRL